MSTSPTPAGNSDRYSNLPQELIAKRGRWVSWKYVNKPGEPKPAKVPVNPRTNAPASHSDPDTWGDFNAAIELTERFRLSGIGFVLSDEDDIVGVDFDHCLIKHAGKDLLLPWVERAIQQLNSYTEYSPSGTGIRIFVKASELPRGQHKFPELELYAKQRFMTVTGNHFPGTPHTIEERTAQVRQVWAVFQQDAETIHRIKQGPKGDDFKALMQGNNLDYPGNSEADMALCNIIAFACGGDIERTDRIFRQAVRNPKFPDKQPGRANLENGKWDEVHFNGADGVETYGEHTVRIVCETIQERRDAARQQVQQDGVDDSHHDFLLNAPFSDSGDYECFARLYGDKYRYEHKTNMWYIRRPGAVSWKEDIRHEHMMDILKTVRARGALATTLDDRAASLALQEHARKQESSNKLAGIEKLSQKMPPFSTDISEYDNNQWALALQNGVLNLRTLLFRGPEANDMFMREADVRYDAAAECPRWRQFVAEIFPDPDVRHYVQKLLGYSLTGDVEQQIMIICLGIGANGKSTLYSMVAAVLGDYATVSDFVSFDAGRQFGGTEDTAILRGTRFVSVIENDEDKRLAEGKIKKLTGSDTLRGEFKYGHSFTFNPTHKLWFAMNRKPKIIGTDYGIWRRIKIIPFMRQFERGKDADETLKEKLMAEKAGILNWLLDGLRMFLAEGAKDPAAVETYVAEYRKESDNVKQWVDEFTIIKEGGTLDADAGYYSYKSWCERGSEYRLSKSKWVERLQEAGYESERRRRNGTGGYQTVFHGLILDDNTSVF